MKTPSPYYKEREFFKNLREAITELETVIAGRSAQRKYWLRSRQNFLCRLLVLVEAITELE